MTEARYAAKIVTYGGKVDRRKDGNVAFADVEIDGVRVRIQTRKDDVEQFRYEDGTLFCLSSEASDFIAAQIGEHSPKPKVDADAVVEEVVAFFDHAIENETAGNPQAKARALDIIRSAATDCINHAMRNPRAARIIASWRADEWAVVLDQKFDPVALTDVRRAIQVVYEGDE